MINAGIDRVSNMDLILEHVEQDWYMQHGYCSRARMAKAAVFTSGSSWSAAWASNITQLLQVCIRGMLAKQQECYILNEKVLTMPQSV
jgi:hypothetical protein